MSKAFPTNTKDVSAPAASRLDVAHNPFNWRTGAPSILYTAAGHRAADRHAQGAGGKALDAQGRALVEMEPHAKQSIQIASRADSIKTQLIKRGTSI